MKQKTNRFSFYFSFNHTCFVGGHHQNLTVGLLSHQQHSLHIETLPSPLIKNRKSSILNKLIYILFIKTSYQQEHVSLSKTNFDFASTTKRAKQVGAFNARERMGSFCYDTRRCVGTDCRCHDGNSPAPSCLRCCCYCCTVDCFP